MLFFHCLFWVVGMLCFYGRSGDRSDKLSRPRLLEVKIPLAEAF